MKLTVLPLKYCNHKLWPDVQDWKNGDEWNYEDETMVPFYGRVKFHQYIPGKSHRYGCKIFKLFTVDGYTWNFEAYWCVSKCQEKLGATDSLVVRLAEKLLENGATINMTTTRHHSHLLSIFWHKRHTCVELYARIKKSSWSNEGKAKERRDKGIGK